MTILNKLKVVFSGKMNAKLVSMENPLESLALKLNQMQNKKLELRTKFIEINTIKLEQENKIVNFETEISQLDTYAKQLGASNDLEKLEEVVNEIQNKNTQKAIYENSLVNITENVEKIKNIMKTEDIAYKKIEAIQGEIKSRYETAKVNKSISDLTSGIGGKAEMVISFDDIESKVRKVELEAASMNELSEIDSKEKSIMEEAQALGTPAIQDLMQKYLNQSNTEDDSVVEEDESNIK